MFINDVTTLLSFCEAITENLNECYRGTLQSTGDIEEEEDVRDSEGPNGWPSIQVSSRLCH